MAPCQEAAFLVLARYRILQVRPGGAPCGLPLRQPLFRAFLKTHKWDWTMMAVSTSPGALLDQTLRGRGPCVCVCVCACARVRVREDPSRESLKGQFFVSVGITRTSLGVFPEQDNQTHVFSGSVFLCTAFNWGGSQWSSFLPCIWAPMRGFVPGYGILGKPPGFHPSGFPFDTYTYW